MDREILQFRIFGYTPDTLPMARLAAFLEQLAVLYGAQDSIHFENVIKGSAVVQAWVARTETERVVARVQSAKRPDAPLEVKKAYARIDDMLRENQTSGLIRRKGGGEILAFPGKKVPVPKSITVTDVAEVEGTVVRVGGTDRTIPVHIQGDDGALYWCYVKDRGLARDFAGMLYGPPVRVRGSGQWERDPNGTWRLISMSIQSWEQLEDDPLQATIERLRAIGGNGWKAMSDPEATLKRVREGG